MEEFKDDSETYKQLYQKYKTLNIKLDNSKNPIVTSVLGGTVVAASLVIGEKAFNINIPTWTVITGFFAGEAVMVMPLFTRAYKIIRTEKKMLKIADKYSHVINMQGVYYDLDEGTYFPDTEAYLDFYHNQLTKEHDGPVKRLKKSK